MPTLADIYSAINTAKRKTSDFIQNPGTSLEQMLGYANDRARTYNQQMVLAGQGTMAQARGQKPTAEQAAAEQDVMDTMANAYNPAGMVNRPLKGAKLVHIPIDMIEHGEAITPGGTLTWPKAKETIKEYASKKTPLPPIDVVSNESGKPWMVADGSRRLEAARLRGEKTIPAYVSPHDAEGLEMIAKQKMTATEAKPYREAKTSDGYTLHEQPDGTWTNGDITFDSLDDLLANEPQLTIDGKIYSPAAWRREEAKGAGFHPSDYADYEKTFDPNFDASRGVFADLYKKGYR